MKGKLIKKDKGWIVEFPISSLHSTLQELSLHPHDVKQIQRDSERFDNIEARIAAYPEVEFEIIQVASDNMGKVNTYAKLIKEKEKCEYSGLPAVSEYIGDITDEDKIEGILDRAMSVEAMKPKEVREQILFLNWLLKHYSTETDDCGFFYYADSTGKEASMLSIVQHYQKEWI
jgi:hypothetical protein